MTIKKTQTGLEVFIVALVLGIAGESLIFGASWGLGATIWMIGVTAVGALMMQRWDAETSKFEQWLPAVLIAVAFCYGWRDAGMLKFATSISLATIFGLTMQSRQHRLVNNIRLRPPGILLTGIRSLIGYPISLSREVDFTPLMVSVEKGTMQSIGRGLLLGIPCVVVFGLLLSSADDGFGQLLGSLIQVDVISLPSRIILIGIFGLVTGAYMRALLTKIEKKTSDKKKKLEPEFHMLEVGIVFGLVNLLFVTFVIMQMGYLFGGATFIESESGLTLAQYARKGFFELVTVAVLALSVLMWVQRYFKPTEIGHETAFKVLAGIQIALLLIMLVSAAQRMWLYTASFGLTELRLYTSAFMAWIAFVLGWFVFTAMRSKALLFVRGSIMAGLAVVIGLHALNPDAMIARTNMTRAIHGEKLDYRYLSSLSADAVPVIIELLPQLSPIDREEVAVDMVRHWYAKPADDWRSWNWSQHRARSVVNEAVKEWQISGDVTLPLHVSDAWSNR